MFTSGKHANVLFMVRLGTDFSTTFLSITFLV